MRLGLRQDLHIGMALSLSCTECGRALSKSPSRAEDEDLDDVAIVVIKGHQGQPRKRCSRCGKYAIDESSER